jgi:putative membrane protein
MTSLQFRKLAWVLGFLSLFVSGIHPADRFTWFLEILPALIGLGVIFFCEPRFPLSNLVTTVVMIHVVILAVGGHYTYAKVPLFDWIRDNFGQARNNYDKVGHFWQGFGPALVAREVLLRTSPLWPGKWLSFLLVSIALAISAVYELVEWWVAVGTGEAADAFLGTQGDPWDTQKDMFTCGLGALAALLLGRVHDRSLKRLLGEQAAPQL